MVTTRKSATRRSPAGPGKQSTLSFSHKVTKSVPQPAKDAVLSSSVTKPVQPSEKAEPSPLKDEVKDEVGDEAKAVPDDAAPELESGKQDADADDDAKVETEVVPEKSELELKAEKISNAAIERYWRGVDSQRTIKQVHQEGLATGERLLRYFDVSSQYGPCIGITRMKRWQRAQRLGLNPPIEVLAVLLREEKQGNEGIEKAHMDEIMNPPVTAD